MQTTRKPISCRRLNNHTVKRSLSPYPSILQTENNTIRPAEPSQPAVIFPGCHVPSSHNESMEIYLCWCASACVHAHTHVQNLGAQKPHFLTYSNASHQEERLKLMPPNRTRDTESGWHSYLWSQSFLCIPVPSTVENFSRSSNQGIPFLAKLAWAAFLCLTSKTICWA